MLKGKITFITGSTRGIGWATARLFASNGATVVLNGVSSQENVDKSAAQIREEFGVECIGFAADARDAKAVRGCYAEIFRKFRALDILVNNAGVLEDAMLGMIPEQVVANTLQINVAAPILHLQEASRLMGRKNSGSIINVSSIIGRVGNSGQALYGASKAALIGLTLSAAKELAPKNIRVNAVAPGFIDSDMTRKLPPAIFEERLHSIGMRRIGTGEDVAKTILFLASDLSAYVTGQVIGVDGCMLI